MTTEAPVDLTNLPDDPFCGQPTEKVLKSASPDMVYTAGVWADFFKSLRLRKRPIFDASDLVVAKGKKDYKVVYPTLASRSKEGRQGFLRVVYGSRMKPIVAAYGLSDGIELKGDADKSGEKKERPTPEQWVADGNKLSTKRTMRFDVSGHEDIVRFFEEVDHAQREVVTSKYAIYNKINSKNICPTFVRPGRSKADTNDDDPPGWTLKLFCHLEKGPEYRKGLSKYVPKFVRVTKWNENDEPEDVEEIVDLSSLVGSEVKCIVEAIAPEISSPPAFAFKQAALVVYILSDEIAVDDLPLGGWHSAPVFADKAQDEDKKKKKGVNIVSKKDKQAASAKKSKSRAKHESDSEFSEDDDSSSSSSSSDSSEVTSGQKDKKNRKKRARSADGSTEHADDSAEPDAKKAKVAAASEEDASKANEVQQSLAIEAAE